MIQEPIPLPDLGTTNVKFSLWYVRVGDAVGEGDRLAEVLIPGAVVEVASPAEGVVHSLLVRTGDQLPRDAILGMLTRHD